MGVPGLWDLLRPAAEKRSLIHLAVVDGFEQNLNGQRGYRIGIDASIWFFHSEWGKEGENPELRTLFFRLCRLAEAPFLPLFVFDGPYRPSFKRGKNINGQRQHWLQSGFKRLIEAFGWEWRQAPGEAEAELAYLNRIGKIDAVLSDDVDNFLFGARVVVRNSSNTLSGNRSRPVLNADGRDDGKHTLVFRAEEFEKREDIDLTRNGMILIGLLSGGDYHAEGVKGCGKLIAQGLARCGFGDSLIDAFLSMEPTDFDVFLTSWRAELVHELKTNSRGIVGKKYAALAKKVPDDFPNVEVLRSYVTPVTSESRGKEVDDRKWWSRDMDIAEVAACCEMFFEWGVKEIIIKRFRTVLWPGACNRILRQAAMEQDRRGESQKDDRPGTPQKKRPPKHLAVGTPSKLITRYFSKIGLDSPEKVKGPLNSQEDDEDPLMIKIHSSRKHASTDHLIEYRVEIDPAQLVALAESGVKGTRRIEDLGYGETFSDLESDGEGNGKKRTGPKAPPDPLGHLRVWLPASLMEYVQSNLVEEFEEKEEAKRAKKEGKGKGRKKATGKDAPEEAPVKKETPQKKTKAPRRLWESTDEEDDEDEERSPVRQQNPAKPKAPAVPKDRELAAVGRARRVFDSSEEDGPDADVPTRPQKSQQPARRHVATDSATSQQVKIPPKSQFAFTMPRPDDSDDHRERSASPIPLRSRTGAKSPSSAPALEPPGKLEFRASKPKPTASAKVKVSLGTKLAQEQLAALQKLPAAAHFFDSDDDHELPEDPFLSKKPRPPPRSSSSSSTTVSKLSASSSSTAVSEATRTVTAPKKARPLPRRSSGSEDSGNVVTKSPRKTKTHTSPRKTEETARPQSPTPKLPSKAKAPPKVVEYIEIGSSDDDLPQLPVLRNPSKPRATSKPPSRAGSESRTLGSFGFAVTKGGTASTKTGAKQKPSRPKQPIIPEDIIDLT